MNLGEEYIVKIEKITNLGLGLSRVDGFVVFVENVCPDDVVKVKITKLTKNYANAVVSELVEASEYRVEPFCPMQKVCGACQLQCVEYSHQLQIKKQIVEETMQNIAKLNLEVNDVISSPVIKNYRHKIQYPISQTKNSKRILAGYYKPKSHEIVNIKYCPIQPEICDKIIDFIRENAKKYDIEGYVEKSHSGDLKHVVIRTSSVDGKNLVVLVVNATKTFDRIEKFARAIYEEFDEVVGVCLNFNSKKTNVILSNKTQCVCGQDYIEEVLIDKTFKIGANTFFQVNPKSAENIFKYVKNYIKENFEKPLVLDAYAGIAAFGICVSDIAETVVSVEENTSSCQMAQEVAKNNKVKNIEIHNMDAEKYFAQEKRLFDVVILDPPRKGCSEKSIDNVLEVCKDTIIYVSCNPATLARDLKYMQDKGCKILSLQPFDMFCHTFHIENVAIIKVA